MYLASVLCALRNFSGQCGCICVGNVVAWCGQLICLFCCGYVASMLWVVGFVWWPFGWHFACRWQPFVGPSANLFFWGPVPFFFGSPDLGGDAVEFSNFRFLLIFDAFWGCWGVARLF